MRQGRGRSAAVMGARLALLGAAVLTGVAAVDSAQDTGHTPGAVLVDSTTPTATVVPTAPVAAPPAPPAPHAARARHAASYRTASR